VLVKWRKRRRRRWWKILPLEGAGAGASFKLPALASIHRPPGAALRLAQIP